METNEKAKILLDTSSYNIIEAHCIYYPIIESMKIDKTLIPEGHVKTTLELTVFGSEELSIDPSKQYILVETGDDNGQVR